MHFSKAVSGGDSESRKAGLEQCRRSLMWRMCVRVGFLTSITAFVRADVMQQTKGALLSMIFWWNQTGKQLTLPLA
jgi:hypothetical protein